MPLRLQYLDKYRMWRDVVHAMGDRLFVPTDEHLAIGEEVPLELSLPSLALHMVVRGEVVGRRLRSQRFAQGVYLRLRAAEVGRCRRFLGLGQPLDYARHGRRSPRFRCALPVKFVHPELPSPCVAKDLSAHGMQVAGEATLVAHQRVKLTIGLDDGTQLPLVAEVSWVSPAAASFGVRFVDLSAEAQAMIGSSISRLEHAEAEAEAEPSRPIVLADDDAEVLTALTRTLTQLGFQVYQARRGDEALELIRELRPPLVLLDVLLCGIDGVDICKTMRADAEMADIPVILLAGLDGGRFHPVADEAGATDYLTKPVSEDELRQLLMHYLPAPGTGLPRKLDPR